MTEDKWRMFGVLVKTRLWLLNEKNGGILLQYVELGGHDQAQHHSHSCLAVPPQKGVAHLPAGVVSLWSSSQQLACCNLVLLLSLEVLV